MEATSLASYQDDAPFLAGILTGGWCQRAGRTRGRKFPRTILDAQLPRGLLVPFMDGGIANPAD